VWPLATAVEALTAPRHNASRQASLLAALLKMAAGNGLLHESVHVDNTQQFSRAEFGW
jgi:meiotically up-regulated gene 157 (Mug157) protein